MTNIKTKSKTAIKQANKDNAKMLVSFRIDIDRYKELSQIAQRKKTNKTRVISELIRLAYLGLYSKPSKILNDFYNDILKQFENKLMVSESKLTNAERKALNLKQEIKQSQKRFYKRNTKPIET